MCTWIDVSISRSASKDNSNPTSGVGGVELGGPPGFPFRRPVEAKKGRVSIQLADRRTTELTYWVGIMRVAYKDCINRFEHLSARLESTNVLWKSFLNKSAKQLFE